MTHEKQKTAVDWLIEQYYGNMGRLTRIDFKQAKELEKQQFCESFANGYLDFQTEGRAMQVAEQYFNETFE